MNARITAAVGLLALSIAACTSTEPDGFGGEPGAHLVLRIEEVGGFIPVEYAFTRQPTVVWMSDGRVYTTPAMIEIYPPPIQIGYEIRQVPPDAIAELRTRAEAAGLTEDGERGPNENGATVADATTTVFTYVSADGTSHEVSAYALGLLDETEGRSQLMELRTAASDPASWFDGLADPVLEEAEAIRIGVRAYDLDDSQAPRSWPLATPLATFGEPGDENAPFDRCGVLSGTDLAAFVDAAGGANTSTPWESDGSTYGLLVDPMTPDEAPSCSPDTYAGA